VGPSGTCHAVYTKYTEFGPLQTHFSYQFSYPYPAPNPTTPLPRLMRTSDQVPHSHVIGIGIAHPATLRRNRRPTNLRLDWIDATSSPEIAHRRSYSPVTIATCHSTSSSTVAPSTAERPSFLSCESYESESTNFIPLVSLFPCSLPFSFGKIASSPSPEKV
jgi:hypothetical protein